MSDDTKKYEEWASVTIDGKTRRMKCPGGWLYALHSAHGLAITFVPDTTIYRTKDNTPLTGVDVSTRD